MGKVRIKGKMVKHKEMMNYSELRPYLPQTFWLTESTTDYMINKYHTVYIKPDKGSGGSGIIKIERSEKGIKLTSGEKRSFIDSTPWYKHIKRYLKPNNKYIIQRGLKLAKYKDSIFDFRIYMQKPKSKWMISGMVARIAAPKQIVTNYHQGGSAEPIEEVLQSLSDNSISKVKNDLKTIAKISHGVAKAVAKRFPSTHELGIDIGIEDDGRIWIIEANTKPAHNLFYQLPDKKMLQTILSNKRYMYS